MNISRTGTGPLMVGTTQYDINGTGITVAIKDVKGTNPDRPSYTAIRVIRKGYVVVQIPMADITQVNGAAFSGTPQAALLAITGLVNQGGSTGLSQADLTALQATIEANMAATYKRKDKFMDFTVSLDFPSVPAQSASAAIVISNTDTAGITASDRIILTLSSNMNKVLNIYPIPGSNLISFYAVNPSAAAVDNLNGTYRVTVYKTG